MTVNVEVCFKDAPNIQLDPDIDYLDVIIR